MCTRRRLCAFSCASCTLPLPSLSYIFPLAISVVEHLAGIDSIGHALSINLPFRFEINLELINWLIKLALLFLILHFKWIRGSENRIHEIRAMVTEIIVILRNKSEEAKWHKLSVWFDQRHRSLWNKVGRNALECLARLRPRAFLTANYLTSIDLN